MRSFSRRRFLAAALPAFDLLAAPERGRVRIADIKAMILQGPRSYTLVKVVSDAGVYGIGEGYGSPDVAIKEGILELRPYFLGKDPLQIETLFERLGTDLIRAASAIEMALWDLAGKVLDVPVATLLGGSYREHVRVYCDEGPPNMLDRAGCNDWADKMKADPAGWTLFAVEPPRSKADPSRDPVDGLLTTHELADIRQGFEYLRDAIGWDRDLIVTCPKPISLRSALQLAEAIAPAKPLWLEGALPAVLSQDWVRLVEASKIPIGSGDYPVVRQDFRDYFQRRACDVAVLDIRNTGGFSESKKIADLADLFNIPIAVHNTGCAVSTLANVQWAASVRRFMAAETVIGRRNWMDDVCLHEGPLVSQGHIAVPQKAGLGVELNPDVARANLGRGEKYWE